MSRKNQFSVSTFMSRDGVCSFRIEDWHEGVRIRRNFKSQSDAVVEDRPPSNHRQGCIRLPEEYAVTYTSYLPPDDGAKDVYAKPTRSIGCEDDSAPSG